MSKQGKYSHFKADFKIFNKADQNDLYYLEQLKNKSEIYKFKDPLKSSSKTDSKQQPIISLVSTDMFKNIRNTNPLIGQSSEKTIIRAQSEQTFEESKMKSDNIVRDDNIGKSDQSVKPPQYYKKDDDSVKKEEIGKSDYNYKNGESKYDKSSNQDDYNKNKYPPKIYERAGEQEIQVELINSIDGYKFIQILQYNQTVLFIDEQSIYVLQSSELITQNKLIKIYSLDNNTIFLKCQQQQQTLVFYVQQKANQNSVQQYGILIMNFNNNNNNGSASSASNLANGASNARSLANGASGIAGNASILANNAVNASQQQNLSQSQLSQQQNLQQFKNMKIQYLQKISQSIITNFNIHEDQELFTLSTESGVIQCFSYNNKKIFELLEPEQNQITCMISDIQNDTIIYSTQKGQINKIDLINSNLIPLAKFNGKVNQINWIYNNQYLLIFYTDNNINMVSIYSYDQFQLVHSIETISQSYIYIQNQSSSNNNCLSASNNNSQMSSLQNNNNDNLLFGLLHGNKGVVYEIGLKKLERNIIYEKQFSHNPTTFYFFLSKLSLDLIFIYYNNPIQVKNDEYAKDPFRICIDYYQKNQ